MSKVKEVNATTAFSMVKKGALIVDVREAREVGRMAFDVPNVLTVPLSRFESRISEIPSDRKIIVTCHSGSRSVMAARMLTTRGYPQVHNLQHGISGWVRNGLPVKQAPKQPAFAWLKRLLGKA
ncbi:MAG: rhodanese-like domain-containing protein [Chlorobiaceae bacterium]|nr:rhodanese-like domain-containing protein [Chlorobiaceae bacterium]